MRLSSAGVAMTRSSVSGSRRNSALEPSLAPAPSLHFFVYEQEVVAFASGEEGSTEGEAVDFASDLESAAAAPNFVDVKRNPHNDPAEIGSQPLESGLEGFFDEFCDGFEFWFGFRFHFGAAENLRDFSMSGEKERVTFAAQVWRRCRSLL